MPAIKVFVWAGCTMPPMSVKATSLPIGVMFDSAPTPGLLMSILLLPVMVERRVAVGGVVGAGGEDEERPAGLSRVAVRIASGWSWGREHRLRAERKREAGERERDEEKESASQSRAVNRFS